MPNSNVNAFYLNANAFYITGPSAVTKQQSISNLSTVSDSLYMPRVQYVPDFSVKIVTDTQYLKINRGHYVAAKRATAMERRATDNESTPPDDAFQKEWTRAISVNTESSGDGVLDAPEGGALLKAPSGGGGGGSSANRPRSLTSDSVKVEFAPSSDGSPEVTVSVNAQANQSETGNDKTENPTS